MTTCLLGLDDAAVYSWDGRREDLELRLGRAALLAIETGVPSMQRYGEGTLTMQLVDVAVDEAVGPATIWLWSVGDSTYMNQLSDDMAATFESIASDVIRGRARQ